MFRERKAEGLLLSSSCAAPDNSIVSETTAELIAMCFPETSKTGSDVLKRHRQSWADGWQDATERNSTAKNCCDSVILDANIIYHHGADFHISCSSVVFVCSSLEYHANTIVYLNKNIMKQHYRNTRIQIRFTAKYAYTYTFF